MFKLDPNPLFGAVVKVRTPSNGGAREECFKAEFRALTISEFNQYNLATPEGARDFLVDVIETVADIEDAGGKPLAYSEDLRDQLIDMPHVRGALINSYLKEIGEAARGN
jgi:hypothetical protein